MNKLSGYTHAITYYRKVEDLGWMYTDLKTTESGLKLHMIILANHEAKGNVRAINFAKL